MTAVAGGIATAAESAVITVGGSIATQRSDSDATVDEAALSRSTLFCHRSPLDPLCIISDLHRTKVSSASSTLPHGSFCERGKPPLVRSEGEPQRASHFCFAEETKSDCHCHCYCHHAWGACCARTPGPYDPRVVPLGLKLTRKCTAKTRDTTALEASPSHLNKTLLGA